MSYTQRWHLSHFPNLVPKKFWPHVDDFLARSLDKGHQSYMMYVKLPLTVLNLIIYISRILNNMYQQDMEEYGNHDLAKFPVLDLLEDSGSVDAWITTDNTFYDKIRPQKLMAKDRVKPQFAEENQAGEKRKRMESDVGGPEEEVWFTCTVLHPFCTSYRRRYYICIIFKTSEQIMCSGFGSERNGMRPKYEVTDV